VRMMTEINGWALLEKMVAFLKPLLSATNVLGGSNYVTSSLVCMFDKLSLTRIDGHRW